MKCGKSRVFVQSVIVMAVMLLLVTGCSKKTPQQVIDVNAAMARAKDNCATVYAPGETQALQGEVDQMNGLVDEQKMKKAKKAADPLLPKVGGLDQTAQENRAKAKSAAEAAMKTAADAVAQAKQAEAAKYNAAGLTQAEGKLAEAKSGMSDPCAYLAAKKLADDATRQANNAREAALAEKRRIEEERRRAEEERRRKEEEARRAEEARGKMFPPTYVVQKGDYLWRISGMNTIYKNPIFWPIIHDANSGKIADPDLIYPGQELTIPRDLSEQQMSNKLYRLWTSY